MINFLKENHDINSVSIFGRPFVKWFALCYRTVVCLVCLWCWCIVAKRLDVSRWNLAWRKASAPTTLC